MPMVFNMCVARSTAFRTKWPRIEAVGDRLGSTASSSNSYVPERAVDWRSQLIRQGTIRTQPRRPRPPPIGFATAAVTMSAIRAIAHVGRAWSSGFN